MIMIDTDGTCVIVLTKRRRSVSTLIGLVTALCRLPRVVELIHRVKRKSVLSSRMDNRETCLPGTPWLT